MAREKLRPAARTPAAQATDARLDKVERAVVLLAAWVVEDRNLGLLALLTANIAHRGLLEGREALAEEECSVFESLKRLEAQFAKNIRERLGKDVDLARPERIPATRRGR